MVSSTPPKQAQRTTSVKIVQFEPVNLRVALEHAAAGFPIFPAKLVPDENGRWSKTPCIADWDNNASTDENQIRQWWNTWPEAAVGIPLGICHLIALDSDRHGGPDGVTALEQLVDQHEPLPPHPITLTAGNGEHHIFRQPDDQKLGNRTGALPKGIDVRGAGGWIVAPDTVRPDGKRWQRGTPSLIEAHLAKAIPELPRWLVNIIAPRAAETNGARRAPTEFEQQFAARSLARYVAELSEMEPETGRNNRLNAIAYSMGRMGGAGWIGEDDVEAALIGACDDNGLSADKASHGERGVRATFRSGWNAGFAKPREPLIPAPFNSEEFLALEYVERHGDDIRYVAKWNRWMVWNGTCWQEDDKRVSFRYARGICRDAALKLDKGGGRLANAKTRAAVVSLAQDDAKIVATLDQWDANPWLLNTPGGTVDLRTGEMREHKREHYITKITAVTPSKSPVPQWQKFLSEITGGDDELVAYLKRLAGYALTGVTDEHSFAFFYGSGGNGKSTFLKTIISSAGKYHRVIPMTALLASKQEQHPTELAGLLGARLVTANETAQGRSWNEPQIKQLTGGDVITARFMQRDFFDFTPQFKLIITGNNKPGLRSVDEAIRRRIHLVPFTVTIPEEQRDRQLASKLESEWPGILGWMIEGCLEWQQKGLAPPKAVVEATNDYLEAQDSIQAFIEEYCVAGPREQVTSSSLFISWTAFCENRGERPGIQRTFNDAIEKKGFKRRKTEKGFVFFGLRLGKKEQEQCDGVVLFPGAPPC